ncbi:MAG: DUF4345 domain-containing protein [Gammaproteobacteria bacterium]|nr:DUF4345 domain-containing protein [Gammaproteobacteria bacterium]
MLVLVGFLILAAPVEFYAANKIELDANVNLLNELKAPAGMLLVTGLFMVGAIFVGRLTDTAMALAALIYLSYAASRFSSMAFDGVPAAGLVQAASLEAVIGLACLSVLLARRAPAKEAA